MDITHFPSRLIHTRVTRMGLPANGWCKHLMTTASPKSNISAETSGEGAEPRPACFCLSSVAMRSALLSGPSLFELSIANSSAMCGSHAAESCAVTPVSSACHEATIADEFAMLSSNNDQIGRAHV